MRSPAPHHICSQASLLLIFTQQKCGAEQKMEIFNPYLGRNQTWIPDDSTEVRTRLP